MNIDISAVVKTAGAELKINESGIIDDLRDIYGVIAVAQPVIFQGTLTNINGLLRLTGEAVCTYETQCDHCTRLITRTIRTVIDEGLLEEQPGSAPEDDQFTYQGNWLLLDKILSDNIVLALPMHHRCEQDCEIICPECGKPVTGLGCGCSNNQSIDPRLAALNDYNKVENQKADLSE